MRSLRRTFLARDSLFQPLYQCHVAATPETARCLSHLLLADRLASATFRDCRVRSRCKVRQRLLCEELLLLPDTSAAVRALAQGLYSRQRRLDRCSRLFEMTRLLL